MVIPGYYEVLTIFSKAICQYLVDGDQCLQTDQQAIMQSSTNSDEVNLALHEAF